MQRYRNFLIITIFVFLPLLAYAAGSLGYSHFDFDSVNQIEILSIIPTFETLFKLTVKSYGADEGQRFFVIILLFMLTFFVQNVVTITLGFLDGSNLGNPLHRWKFFEVVSVLILLAAFYTFFFLPSFTMTLTSRSATAAHFTDYKYFLIAGLFLLFRAIPYQLAFTISRILTVARAKNRTRS